MQLEKSFDIPAFQRLAQIATVRAARKWQGAGHYSVQSRVHQEQQQKP